MGSKASRCRAPATSTSTSKATRSSGSAASSTCSASAGSTTSGDFQFKAFWGHDDVGERAAFEGAVDFIVERRRADPDLHVYHYAAYERTAFGRLMGKYGTREDEVDDLLRGRVLVDLFKVVRQGVRVGVESYSIKKLEPLYMAPRDGAITDAGSSIVEYERWLETHDPQILFDIEKYNRDDCESTWRLHHWLEARRAEAEQQFDRPLERPVARIRRTRPTTTAERDRPTFDAVAPATCSARPTRSSAPS